MTLSKLTTLADWLDHIERQHPKSIDMGLDRVRAVADGTTEQVGERRTDHDLGA